MADRHGAFSLRPALGSTLACALGIDRSPGSRKFLRVAAFQRGMEALEPGVDISEHRDTDGSLILCVGGELDEGAARAVAHHITDSTSPLWALVLDLDGVEVIDARGLGLLLTAIDRGRAEGCSVSLATPRGPLLRLFRRAGLEPALPLSTRESAPRVRGRFARIAGRG